MEIPRLPAVSSLSACGDSWCLTKRSRPHLSQVRVGIKKDRMFRVDLIRLKFPSFTVDGFWKRESSSYKNRLGLEERRWVCKRTDFDSIPRHGSTVSSVKNCGSSRFLIGRTFGKHRSFFTGRTFTSWTCFGTGFLSKLCSGSRIEF